jgi:hypothetical protein
MSDVSTGVNSNSLEAKIASQTPGATSGQAKTASAAAQKGRGKDMPRNGKPLFDYREGERLFGKLRRFLDDCATTYGRCQEHYRCLELMDKVLTEWYKWQEKILRK